ncbi:hypothetical protein IJ531_03545 [bacterium]|nr:hypothetical protein [bacterium]
MKIPALNFNYRTSFRANMNELYPPFKREMTKYIMQDSFTLSGMKDIIHKYSPKTEVESFEDMPEELEEITQDYGAFTLTPVSISIGENGIDAGAELISETIYFDPPDSDDLESRITFLDNTLHETTHIFQTDADDRVSLAQLQDRYMKSADDKHKALRTFSAAYKAYQLYENLVVNTFRDYYRKRTSLPEIAKGDNIDEIFRKQTEMTALEFADLVLDMNEENIKSISPDFDFNFLYDFIDLMTASEIEAYTNGVTSSKEILGIDETTDLDLLIELYKVMKEAALKRKE